MLLVSKIVWAGIAVTLVTTGMLVQGFPRNPAGSDPNKGGAAFVIKDEVTKMQETLHNRGHHQGKVDGVFGLQTRASIRAYQKAEHLTVTGQVDAQTADRLGIRPESTWDPRRKVGYRSGEAVGGTAKVKPSPYIEWAGASGRTSKTLRKEVSRVIAIEDSRAKQQQAENENYERR